MSEQDNVGVTNPSPGQQPMIPKERFDELVNDRRALQEQLQVQQQLLRSLVPNGQPAEQEPDHLKQLKERDPVAYQLFKDQELKLKQQAGALFAFGDNQDRLQFLQHYGEEGKKYIGKVEAELTKLRGQNINSYNREQLFLHLRGLESLQPKAAPAINPAPAAAQTNADAPSSDPSAAGTTVGGSATAAPVRRTLEDLERDIGDKVF